MHGKFGIACPVTTIRGIVHDVLTVIRKRLRRILRGLFLSNLIILVSV
jgi:hypothetical protein